LALFAAAALVLHTHAAFAGPLPARQALPTAERHAAGPGTSGIFRRSGKVSFMPHDARSRTSHE
jgi:hypothetical protein